MISIDVEGRPAPKGSRISARTKAGKSYTYPASKYERPWVLAVKEATQVVMRHHAQPEPPYTVELEFRLVEPKPHARRAKHPTMHDLDKLARAAIDGLVAGGALSDDRHVTCLTATKRYLTAGESAGMSALVATRWPDVAGISGRSGPVAVND